MGEADQELYKNFPLVISERWQQEVAETVFETINQEADKVEHKRRAKHKHKFDDEKGVVYDYLRVNTFISRTFKPITLFYLLEKLSTIIVKL